MLNQVNFPLSNAQLSEFFLTYHYTKYFIFQEVISDLSQAGLILTHSTHGTTRYELTKDGMETLKFFETHITEAAIQDMRKYLEKNKFQFRTESGNIAEYYQNSNLEYIVHFEMREGKTKLINLELSAVDEESAKHMCDVWREKSTEIYQYLMMTLL